MPERHLHRLNALRRALLESESALDRTTRRAAAEGTLDGDLGALARKVHDHPSTVTDDDVASLRAKGHSDDALFELIVTAAFGAADARFAAATRALGKKS